jgi:phosphoribosylglycinamide formyltransferase 2
MASPGASAVIYGGVEGGAMTFEGVEEALKIPQTELRLFGKPESFVKRRMGVALARATTTGEARTRAKRAASSVKPAVYLSQ